MCDVATIAGMALSAAMSMMQAREQSKAAEQQNAFERARFEQTQENANANFLAQAAQQNLRLSQEAEAMSQEVQQTNIEKAQAKASAAVSAGEAGVSGLSVDALMADFERTATNKNNAARRNLEFLNLQAEEDLKGIEAQTRNQIVAALPNYKSGPSFMGTALKIGADAFGIAQRGGAFKKAPKRGGGNGSTVGNFSPGSIYGGL